jgi:hypothetical protein
MATLEREADEPTRRCELCRHDRPQPLSASVVLVPVRLVTSLRNGVAVFASFLLLAVG